MASKAAVKLPGGVPGYAVRALSDQTQLAVGNFTLREMRKGSVYNVPVDVAQHLSDHGIAIIVEKDSEDDPHFDQTVETDAELAAKVRTENMGIVDV